MTRPRSPRRSPRRPRPRPTRCPASGTRSTGRSTRGPSGSSSSPTSVGVSGPHVLLARCLRDAVAGAWGRPLTMNVSMPIAAVMLDLGFEPSAVKAVPILARTASLLAHLDEEQQLPVGFLMASAAEEAVDYRAAMLDPPDTRAAHGPSSSRSMTRPTARSSSTCSSARPSTATSSPAPASQSAPDAGGLADIAQLPLTEKQELRASCTPDNPIGAHLCATPRRDRPHLLDQRHDRDAELHPADGVRRRQLGRGLGAQLRRLGDRRRAANRLDLQRRPVRGRRGAVVVRAHRAVPHPARDRQHGTAGRRDPAARAAGRRADAVVRRTPDRVGGRARASTSRARASSGCWSRASLAAASPPSGTGCKRVGAPRSPRRWGSATSASRCGASASARTACISAPVGSCTPS